MGTIEIITANDILIRSHLVIYGDAANAEIAAYIREEVETMWNEPQGQVFIKNDIFNVRFTITTEYSPELESLTIYENTDPAVNYFRVEEFSHNHISFVDGIGCNTGYFKLDNLYKGSTTAAHEYGHTMGLKHPEDIDIRGWGIPGIMYPRGTIVDAAYQYNPVAIAGDGPNGGTMNPQHRRVTQADISQLNIHKLRFNNKQAVLGEFSSCWHPNHKRIAPFEFFGDMQGF